MKVLRFPEQMYKKPNMYLMISCNESFKTKMKMKCDLNNPNKEKINKQMINI